jgi:hypothetical protein
VEVMVTFLEEAKNSVGHAQQPGLVRRGSTLPPHIPQASIIPTPDRSMRLLWDQFHTIKYPPGEGVRSDTSQSVLTTSWRNGAHVFGVFVGLMFEHLVALRLHAS